MRRSVQQKAQIVDSVRRCGGCSRLDISSGLSIAPPIVSSLVRDLLDLGVLVEEGLEPSGGGRPRRRVGINRGFASVIGVQVAMRSIRGGLIDLSGRLIAEHREPASGSAAVEESLEAIGRTIDTLKQRCGPGRLCGIGIGISGVIREGGSVCREFPFGERWADVPLSDIVAERCGIRPALINDVQAATLGELRLGGWGEVRNMVSLHLGDGIAAGVVINGELYRGATMNAGEVGHIVLREDGPLCYCGNRGCLESLASPRAVMESCAEAVARGVHTAVVDEAAGSAGMAFDHVVSAAAKGDRLACNLLNDAGRYMGEIAASLINVFDPALLLLGGLLSAGRNDLVETIERTARSRVLPLLRDATRVELSRLKEEASLLGAGVLVMDELFGDAEALLARGFIRDG